MYVYRTCTQIAGPGKTRAFAELSMSQRILPSHTQPALSIKADTELSPLVHRKLPLFQTPFRPKKFRYDL
jgi:hypothetical protein